MHIEAKEIAAALKKLEPERIHEIITFYEAYLAHPASMHVPLERDEEAAIKHLVGEERLKNIILVKTKALIFAPSILVPFKFSIDYGTAMHRRFFLHGLWFSIIAMNEAYIKSATPTMLRYMIEHELALGKYYKELAMHNVKVLTPIMKGVIHEEMKRKAIEQSGISTEEVEEERQLILNLPAHHPVVPVHLASGSLFRYLEANWEHIKRFGLASQNETEKKLEIPHEKLGEWAEFGITTFKIFVHDLKRELTMTGAEYGMAIV